MLRYPASGIIKEMQSLETISDHTKKDPDHSQVIDHANPENIRN